MNKLELVKKIAEKRGVKEQVARDFLDLTLAAFVYYLQFWHFASQLLLHGRQVDSLSALWSLILLAHTGIEGGLSKLPRHIVTFIAYITVTLFKL